MLRVLVVGGYGNFGTRITSGLMRIGGLEVVVVGRNVERAKKAAQQMGAEHAQVDVRSDGLATSLRHIGGDVIVSAMGPIQGDDYALARRPYHLVPLFPYLLALRHSTARAWPIAPRAL